MTDTMMSTTAAIERRLSLAASPDRVWRAITESDEVAAWFSQRATMPAAIDEVGWLEWDGHGRYPVRIVALEPGRHVAWKWASTPDAPLGADATLVEWTLEPGPAGGTILHLRESGFQTDSGRRGNVEGWLSELGELLDHLASEPWQRGIHRTWEFTSPPERVWRAFTDPAEFAAWWGGTEPSTEIRAGQEGWFAWPTEGRFAMRFEAVEPPTYLAWSWTTTPDLAMDEAPEVLRTEWLIEAGPDGGTKVSLLETGFIGPDNHRQNSAGWDSDMEPMLRRHLGEAS